MNTPAPHPATHLFTGWAPAQTATVIAALIAVLGVVATILTAADRTAREHRTKLYAQALSTVADYLEGPYRIRRKDGTAAHRNAITAALSDVKSAIDHSQELMRLHAPPAVANAFDHYVTAAKLEAGKHMHDAWLLPAIENDADVNLDQPYDRTLSDKYRAHVVSLMQADLARRTWNLARNNDYRQQVRAQPGRPSLPDDRSEEATPAPSIDHDPRTETPRTNR